MSYTMYDWSTETINRFFCGTNIDACSFSSQVCECQKIAPTAVYIFLTAIIVILIILIIWTELKEQKKTKKKNLKGRERT